MNSGGNIAKIKSTKLSGSGSGMGNSKVKPETNSGLIHVQPDRMHHNFVASS